VKSATLAQLRDEHPEIYQKVYPAITVQSDASDAIVGGYAGIGPD
jgi:hypothetical protein